MIIILLKKDIEIALTKPNTANSKTKNHSTLCIY